MKRHPGSQADLKQYRNLRTWVLTGQQRGAILSSMVKVLRHTYYVRFEI
jgi:hypothetical protein